MTYSFVELSAQDAKPVLLFEFVQGGQTWRYAASPFDVSHASETWAASSISMSEIKQGMDMSKNGLSLKFHQGNVFAQQFLGPTPEQVTSVKIHRGHVGDGEFVVYWRGRVVSGKSSGAEISLDCESIFTSLRRPGLRARFTRNCRFAVYGRGCNLDPEDFALLSLITSASGTSVVVPNAALQADGWYLGGMLRFGIHLRMITAHAGDQLTLSRPIPSLEVALTESGYGLNYGSYYGGVGVQIYSGCDRSETTCDTKFNNLDNNGAFLRIPSINPMGGSSIV